jgi:hypothetical protein
MKERMQYTACRHFYLLLINLFSAFSVQRSAFKIMFLRSLSRKQGITALACLLTCLIATTAHANYPLPPRFSANAYASDYTVGNADLLIPINSNYCTHNLYLDPMAEYGTDNDGYVDLGLGYRWIQKKAAILGGYLFVGRDRVDNNAHLWVFNPGVEALGSRWDAHLNAYLVAGD